MGRFTGAFDDEAPASKFAGAFDDDVSEEEANAAKVVPMTGGGPPRVPMSGVSPEDEAAMYARKAPPEPSIGQKVIGAFTKAANDPFGAVGGAVGKIGERTGLLGQGSEARGERFGTALGQSLGPIGMEFAPLASAPRQAPARAPQPMPSGSVRTTEELKSTGGSRMGDAKKSTVALTPTQAGESLVGMAEKFKEKGLRINPDLHPTAAKVANRLRRLVASGSSDPMSAVTGTKPAGPTPATLQDLHELRQLTQDVIDAGLNPATRKPNTEGLMGRIMQQTIDDMIAKHPEGPEFLQGKGEYARGMKAQTIEKALDDASTTSQWASGNQAGAIRNAAAKLYKDKNIRWTPEEKKQLRKLMRFSLMSPIAGMGSTGPMGFTLGRVVETILGIPPMMGYVAAIPARAANNAGKVSQMGRLSEMVRAGGPVQAGRFEKAKQLFSPKVFEHIAKDSEGAKRIRAWSMTPSAQTARALASYTAQKVGQPQLAERIFAELQGTDESQAQE
jgi:hypothetical protein